MRKYTLLLLTLFLLASCGKSSYENSSVKKDGDVSELNIPLTESASGTIIQEIEKEIDTLGEMSDLRETTTTKQISEKVPTIKKELPLEKPKKEKDATTETTIIQEAPVSTIKEAPENNTNESKVIQLNQVYTYPGGEEQITFTVTTIGNTINSVRVKGSNENKISEKYVQRFTDAINTEISGKTLEEAQNIGVVGGSSLTTGAFKKALKNM